MGAVVDAQHPKTQASRYIVILRGLLSCKSPPYDSVNSRYVKAWPGGRLELLEYSAVEDELSE